MFWFASPWLPVGTCAGMGGAILLLGIPMWIFWYIVFPIAFCLLVGFYQSLQPPVRIPNWMRLKMIQERMDVVEYHEPQIVADPMTASDHFGIGGLRMVTKFQPGGTEEELVEVCTRHKAITAHYESLQEELPIEEVFIEPKCYNVVRVAEGTPYEVRIATLRRGFAGSTEHPAKFKGDKVSKFFIDHPDGTFELTDYAARWVLALTGLSVLVLILICCL